MNKGSSRQGDQGKAESIEASTPVFLQYPIPYTLDAPTPMLVAQSSTELHFGNPYSTSDPQGILLTISQDSVKSWIACIG